MSYVTTILVLLTAIFAVSAFKSYTVGAKASMLIYSILTVISITFCIRAQIFRRKKDHGRKNNDQ